MPYDAFLDQSEVDALLAEHDIGTKPAPTPEAVDPGAIRAYDLGSPDRVVRRRMQTLEMIHDQFARHLRASLLAFIRRNADITVGPMQVQKYSDFERNLPVPSNLNLVSLAPLKGQALFVFDPALVFLIIESLFGGQLKYYSRIEGRDFTATEQRIIARLLTHTLASYSKAWSGVFPIDAQYARSEMHTKFASIANANEAVIVTPITIEFGIASGVLHIALPYSMIEPVRDLLTRPFRPAQDTVQDRGWTQSMRHQARDTMVCVAATFAHVDMTVGELTSLGVGSVLPIRLPKKITAHVDGVPVLECGFGTRNRHYALIVERHLNLPEPSISEEVFHGIEKTPGPTTGAQPSTGQPGDSHDENAAR
ncbi:MAG: flagellar motor switch protein FliM [Candidimonas sp.]|nr:MAG: flagellar motor switch protein FliM [Candidimonas sp.]